MGGGGYAGTVGPPAAAVQGGYIGITTDTGHTGSDGTFGMKSPGVANEDLWVDFAYRSEHLMSVVGKQLAQAFYGKPPELSYWNGCSTGGRQGLMMAQRFPEDYNGILAGAPAINWDRFQAAQMWPQVAMRVENGGAVDAKKITLATNAAIEACDGLDGVKDGVLEEPRACKFDARTLVCTGGASGDSCLTTGEAAAINKIWEGPKGHWYGLTRSTPVQQMLAGAQPFMISVNQPRYWVYLDPTWDWKTLNYDNYGKFFDDTVRAVGPVMATNNPDLDAFRKHGGKLILWHGWSDPGIMPEGTIDYYEKVAKRDGGDYKKYVGLAKDKGSGFKLMGFGHRVYKNFDPRSRILKAAADEVLAQMGKRDPLLDIASELERVALEDSFFVERKLYPNVDFYSGIIYRAMGIPTNMFTVMFALGRLPGWIAHWKEMREEGARINRPRQIYTGATERHFVPPSSR